MSHKKDLLRDIEKAPEFDQSALFKKVYEEEYGVFGGAPFGALIGDYEFGKHPEDSGPARRHFRCGGPAHAPFVSGPGGSRLLNLELHELDAPRDLAKILTAPNMQSGSDSVKAKIAYVALCLPSVIRRASLMAKTKPIDEFSYESMPMGLTTPSTCG